MEEMGNTIWRLWGSPKIIEEGKVYSSIFNLWALWESRSKVPKHFEEALDISTQKYQKINYNV